jgi:hypothetical protein
LERFHVFTTSSKTIFWFLLESPSELQVLFNYTSYEFTVTIIDSRRIHEPFFVGFFSLDSLRRYDESVEDDEESDPPGESQD